MEAKRDLVVQVVHANNPLDDLKEKAFNLLPEGNVRSQTLETRDTHTLSRGPESFLWSRSGD